MTFLQCLCYSKFELMCVYLCLILAFTPSLVNDGDMQKNVVLNMYVCICIIYGTMTMLTGYIPRTELKQRKLGGSETFPVWR